MGQHDWRNRHGASAMAPLSLWVTFVLRPGRELYLCATERRDDLCTNVAILNVRQEEKRVCGATLRERS